MEPILDVFSNDAFSFVTLTDSINKLPFVPGRLGSLGLFTEAPVPTTSIRTFASIGGGAKLCWRTTIGAPSPARRTVPLIQKPPPPILFTIGASGR